eukprot:CAMPEP_0169315340 /NCGR_PEP_ID=MMETSP1017-20121227/5591_1 /TAXON_ID=342587 /ORGANISM="Karlodinium micrum, Strain CCMP2283" /LENGTH=135 /DNA_ID=CAMNT_0009409323 /DNA_START=302 /DNA_END=710 /DNA_ORIENTATION=-
MAKEHLVEIGCREDWNSIVNDFGEADSDAPKLPDAVFPRLPVGPKSSSASNLAIEDKSANHMDTGQEQDCVAANSGVSTIVVQERRLESPKRQDMIDIGSVTDSINESTIPVTPLLPSDASNCLGLVLVSDVGCP